MRMVDAPAQTETAGRPEPTPTFLRATWSVVLLAFLTMTLSPSAAAKNKFPKTLAPGVTQLAELPKGDFKECSGLVVSRQYPGVLWTHNDGQDRRLFAIDRRGTKLAEFELHGVFVWDFEDLAIDESNRLYFADIGNNLEVRPNLVVHRVAEPDPKRSGEVLKADATWTLTFPEKGFDAEALFVWRDFGYLISKSGNGKKGRLYRWPLSAAGKATVLEEVGKMEIKAPITGADLSPDGKKLGLVATDGAYVIDIPGSIESVVKPEPYHVEIKTGQIEGCAFDKDGLLTIAESRELLLFSGRPFVPATAP